MLMYGLVDAYLQIGDESILTFNITSFREGFQRLPGLIPPIQLGHLSKRDFDISYANYIMSNDIVFKQFFDIVYSLYIGKEVFLLMDGSEWSENIIESILKLIQQRYGYDGCRIESFEDYIFMKNSKYLSQFNTEYGILNLDIDRERYTYIVEQDRIRNGGQLIIYE